MTNYFTLQQIFCIPSQPFPPSRAAQMMILLGPVQCSSTFPRQADRHAANSSPARQSWGEKTAAALLPRTTATGEGKLQACQLPCAVGGGWCC
jgi:hypothetical protein